MNGCTVTSLADLLTTYRRLREVRLHLANTLVKPLTKADFHEAARALGMLEGDTVVFDSEGQAAILMDCDPQRKAQWSQRRRALSR
jgi:hypothetical protein